MTAFELSGCGRLPAGKFSSIYVEVIAHKTTVYEHPRTMHDDLFRWTVRSARDPRRRTCNRHWRTQSARSFAVKTPVFDHREYNRYKAHRGTLTEARRRKAHSEPSPSEPRNPRM